MLPAPLSFTAREHLQQQPLAMDEEPEIELEDLALDEIQELLSEAGAEVSEEQAEQLAHFVEEAGGIEEALAILSALAQQDKAA